jgi:hypothetical protein
LVVGVIALVAVGAVAAILFATAWPVSPIGGSLKTSPENLNLDYYTISSDSGQQNPTVLTLWLINNGAYSTTPSSLSVKDTNPSTSPVSFQLNGVTIDPGMTRSITVDTLGSGLYFSHGIEYDVSVVASRGILTYAITY